MKLVILYVLLSSFIYAQDDLLEKANAGNHSAATMVGIYYKNGENGFEKNIDEARKYFKIADDNGRNEGNFVGAFMLGLLEYENDPEKSFKIWAKMRQDHEIHKSKFNKETSNSEIQRNQKEILSELKNLNKHNSNLRRRIIDDLEDAAGNQE
jgi:TPR repeat protein